MARAAFLLVFFLFLSPLGIFSTDANMGLQANESVEDFKNYIKYRWTTSDNDLFCEFRNPIGLLISDNYSIIKGSKGGIGIRMECTPIDGAVFSFDDCEYPLKKVTYEIIVTDEPDTDVVNYEVYEEMLYEDSGWFTTNSTTITYTAKGRLTNMSVDLEQYPILAKTSSEIGYIKFALRKTE